MNSHDYIKKKSKQWIELYELQSQCDHKWEEYALGYQCNKCDYYTGQNEELNKIIEKELQRIEKLKRITK